MLNRQLRLNDPSDGSKREMNVHEVVLVCSLSSGKCLILCDDEEIYHSQKDHCNLMHSWEIGNSLVKMVCDSMGTDSRALWQYFILVDDCRYDGVDSYSIGNDCNEGSIALGVLRDVGMDSKADATSVVVESGSDIAVGVQGKEKEEVLAAMDQVDVEKAIEGSIAVIGEDSSEGENDVEAERGISTDDSNNLNDEGGGESSESGVNVEGGGEGSKCSLAKNV